MKLKYEPSSHHFLMVCNETHEEKVFSSEAECLSWARSVAHTFAEDMTFTVKSVTEKSAQIWVTRDQEIGLVR